MFDPQPISRTGYNKLMKELTQLETVDLPEVKKAVATARDEGDLKENSAYIYGRQRHGHIVGRIGELKGTLNLAEIVDCTKVECDLAMFGTVVTLLDLDTKKNVTYQLLGSAEADIDTGSISIQSPIGQSIFRQAVGDKITVTVPSGDRHLEVIEIARPEID